METQPIITEADLKTEAFQLAEQAHRGTWLCLKAAASRQGGNVIPGAAEWDERRTNVRLNVLRRDLAKESELWWVEGADLHVASAEYSRPEVTEASRPVDGKSAAAGE